MVQNQRPALAYKIDAIRVECCQNVIEYLVMILHVGEDESTLAIRSQAGTSEYVEAW